MKIRLALKAGLLASFLCASALAQDYKPFPGDTLNQRTRLMQERVEELYMAGNVERALLIYENDLAPIGDKYAQYMVGYMHLHGEGVEQDRIKALAWFRLAAERGEPLLVRMRDEVAAGLTPDQIQTSDVIFLDLWKSMGDRRLIMDLIRRDMDTLESQTGTRLPGNTATGPLIVIRPSGEQVGPNFYVDVRMRLKARIEYLDARVEIEDMVLADEFKKIRDMEVRVKNELSRIEVQ